MERPDDRPRDSSLALAALLALAWGLRFASGAGYHLPYDIVESDAWVAVNPAWRALQGGFLEIFRDPQIYGLYGSLYPMLIWCLAVPLTLLRALRGHFPADVFAGGAIPVSLIIREQNVIAAARIVSGLAGWGTVAVTYAIGRRLFGRRTALVGTFFFTVAPVAVYYSLFAKEIGVLLFLANLSVYFLVRHLQEGRERDFFTAAGLAGLAASAQQTGFLYVAGAVGGGLFYDLAVRRTPRWGKWVLGAVVASAAYVVGNPNIVFQTGGALSRLGWLLAMFGRDLSTPLPPAWKQIWGFLPSLTGTGIFLLALLGWAWISLRGGAEARVASLAPLLVLLMAVASKGRIVAYYFLVATPWLALSAGYALVEGGGLVLPERLRARIPKRFPVSADRIPPLLALLAGVGVTLSPLAASLAVTKGRVTETPEVTMGKWLEKNLPLHAFVAADGDFPSIRKGMARFPAPPPCVIPAAPSCSSRRGASTGTGPMGSASWRWSRGMSGTFSRPQGWPRPTPASSRI